jgi:hypothetical protein
MNDRDGGSAGVKGFADLPERDKKYVIGGAFFLVSLGILLAIFCIRRLLEWTAKGYGCDARGGPPTEKHKSEPRELSFGAVVSDDELVHLEKCIRNPTGPSRTILEGAALLRELRGQQ